MDEQKRAGRRRQASAGQGLLHAGTGRPRWVASMSLIVQRWMSCGVARLAAGVYACVRDARRATRDCREARGSTPRAPAARLPVALSAFASWRTCLRNDVR